MAGGAPDAAGAVVGRPCRGGRRPRHGQPRAPAGCARSTGSAGIGPETRAIGGKDPRGGAQGCAGADPGRSGAGHRGASALPLPRQPRLGDAERPPRGLQLAGWRAVRLPQREGPAERRHRLGVPAGPGRRSCVRRAGGRRPPSAGRPAGGPWPAPVEHGVGLLPPALVWITCASRIRAATCCRGVPCWRARSYAARPSRSASSSWPSARSSDTRSPRQARSGRSARYASRASAAATSSMTSRLVSWSMRYGTGPGTNTECSVVTGGDRT